MLNLLAQLDQMDGNPVVLEDSSKQLCKKPLLDSCRKLIATLKACNSKTVALFGDNSSDWVIIDLACQQADICLVPIRPFSLRLRSIICFIVSPSTQCSAN